MEYFLITVGGLFVGWIAGMFIGNSRDFSQQRKIIYLRGIITGLRTSKLRPRKISRKKRRRG